MALPRINIQRPRRITGTTSAVRLPTTQRDTTAPVPIAGQAVQNTRTTAPSVVSLPSTQRNTTDAVVSEPVRNVQDARNDFIDDNTPNAINVPNDAKDDEGGTYETEINDHLGEPGAEGGGGSGAERDLTEIEEDFIRDMIGGASDVDTSEQEALIRELGMDAQGQALVDQRASMGRAGFAASGALGAIEGDIRRKQGQADSGAILDERTRAQSEANENAFKGIGADADLRAAAMDEFLIKQILELMGEGGEGEGGEGEGGEGEGGPLDGSLPEWLNPGTNMGIDDGTNPLLGKGTDQAELADSGVPTPEEHDDLPRVSRDALPDDAEVIFNSGLDSADGYTVFRYMSEDGSQVLYARVDN